MKSNERAKQYPRIPNKICGIDFTDVNLQELLAQIDPQAWERMIDQAKELQTSDVHEFQIGDAVFDPATRKIYEIQRICCTGHGSHYPKLHFECRPELYHGPAKLEASSVIHLGYIVDALSSGAPERNCSTDSLRTASE